MTIELQNQLVTGTVLRASGSLYEVDVTGEQVAGEQGTGKPTAEVPAIDTPLDEGVLPGEDATNDRVLLCSLRGKLKHGKRSAAQPVSVGDRVQVRPLTSFGPDARGRRLREGYIETVLPRRSALGRSRYGKTSQVAVANLDQVVIVMSLREPELNTHRLDRFLVLAEASDLRAIICFNKCDLLNRREIRQEVKPLIKLYGELGYTPLATSGETDEGIEALRAALTGHISAMLGSSGVGKSSLVNATQPGLRLWVGDVMDMGKGRHTTTEVSLHPLDSGGYIADTPGIKTVSLLEQEEINLPQCFPEIARLDANCRFNDCSHTIEPGCAVRAAVETGEIAAARYDSYRKMQADEALRPPVYSR